MFKSCTVESLTVLIAYGMNRLRPNRLQFESLTVGIELLTARSESLMAQSESLTALFESLTVPIAYDRIAYVCASGGYASGSLSATVLVSSSCICKWLMSSCLLAFLHPCLL